MGLDNYIKIGQDVPVEQVRQDITWLLILLNTK